MFSKVDNSGNEITRDFLLLKKIEMMDPSVGLDRLRKMGWDVGQLGDVTINGQRVFRNKAY